MARIKTSRLNRGNDPRCLALQPGGNECLQPILAPRHHRCELHQQEYKEHYNSYKDAETRYTDLQTPEDESDLDKIKDKIARGKETIELRTKVNQRFFSQAMTNNRGHVRWILKLSEEIGVLEDKVKLALEGPPQKLVFRSLLSPEVPISDVPADSPARDIKETLLIVTEGQLSRLYKVAPSLNDSLPMIEDREENTTREPDEGDHVMRYILREFLLWRADEEALSKAKKIESIDHFLRSVGIQMLEDLIKVFELLGRPDTLHFLRDAVCDYLVSCDAPNVSSTVILGGRVITYDKQQKMTVHGWDILYRYFRNVVHWSNIESFCVGFDDAVLVQRLIAMRRYGNGDDFEWSHETQQENKFAVSHGFVPAAKGFADPPIPPTVVQDGVVTQRQSRCYLVGRMAKNDPLATPLMQELVRRVARYIVIVLDMEKIGNVSTKTIYRNDEHEEMPWITRKKSVDVGESLDDIPWTIEWSFQDIMADMAAIRALKEREMRKDYFEFIIIIDQAPTPDFRILDEVADALALVADDPSMKQTVEKVAQNSLPREEQSRWLEEILPGIPFALNLSVGDCYYEGSRLRAWDVLDEDPGFLRGFQGKQITKRDRRIIAKVLADMEKAGVVSALKSSGPACGFPVVRKGTDGLEDIYFFYGFRPMSASLLSRARGLAQAHPRALYTFSQKAKAKYPDAIFAKGRIHVHYCAWPITPPEYVDTFRTAEGHLYQWKALPFDYTFSSHLWQHHIDKTLNQKLPFVFFCLTTFIIFAPNQDRASANLRTLLAAAGEHGWKLSVPEPQEWTTDIDSLGPSTLWKGVSPALFKPEL